MVSAVSVFMTIVVEKLAKFAHITSGVDTKAKTVMMSSCIYFLWWCNPERL